MSASEAAPAASLQLTEAVARRALLDITSYDVRLDLASDQRTFASVTTIDFTSKEGETFLDLKPVAVRSIILDGDPLDVDALSRGRLPLTLSAGKHRIVVDAQMRFRNDGEGLHLSVDPADGRPYVYGMSFMDAAPSIFACFDQPDLKAPYTFHVTAPLDWELFGNAPGSQVEPGVWEFEPTQPLSTYFVTLVAGPWHVVRDQHDGIPLSLSARRSLAPHLDKDADELLTLTRRCFDEFHRLFGIRYPFGDYHQAFVPEFNAGAMENPGCITFRDPLIFTSKVTRGERIQRATTVAHEMAHQWFGNITTPRWWDDLWLNESFAEYMGNRVTADVTQYADAWTHNAWSRRQWGLVADQRPSTHPVAGNGATDAVAALQDFDGISYAKGSSILRQLNARVGDDVFLAGVIDHLTAHRFGNATMADLFAAWERAGAGDLSGFTDGWLRTSGPDTLRHDAAAGVLRLTPASPTAPSRSHALEVARLVDGEWQLDAVTVDGDATPVGPATALVVDPHEQTWALALPDPSSISALIAAGSGPDDPRISAGLWNNVRSAFHNAAIDPALVVDLAAVTIPRENVDYALRTLVPWLVGKVVPLAADPAAARTTLHTAFSDRAGTAPAGSTLQLGAIQGAIDTCSDAGLLARWRHGDALPAGVEVDLALRWRILQRLAVLGAIDEAGLAAEFDVEPATQAAVARAGALASLPHADAKEWAWARFAGAEDATNYELEAIGHGFWATEDESLTAPYVARYFDEVAGLPAVHSGWVLGDVVSAFFPLSVRDASVVASAQQVVDSEGLDLTIRRRLVDATDELERRLAVREMYR